MMIVAAPYLACMIAVACVYFSWRKLAFLMAVLPMDLAALARAKVSPALVAQHVVRETPFGALVHALTLPRSERAYVLNEALLDMNHAIEVDRRMPRVLASIGTSACLMLASLVLREVLSSDAADSMLEAGVFDGPLSSALAVGLWGVFAATTCVAIYSRTLRVEREFSRGVDAYVDALDPLGRG